ncbi:MAG: DUF4421 domain-containing protein [Treponema sp.]|jgi:hypothetical protein|nr:DUF4421 domain-containing protein [Treponema sp.]
MGHRKKYLWAIIFVFLSGAYCAAGENNAAEAFVRETGAEEGPPAESSAAEGVKDAVIEDFSNKFSLGLALRYNGMYFLQENEPDENISSDLPLDFGLIAAFEWLTLTFNLSLINTFNSEFLKAKSFDAQIDLYRETMYWKFFAKNYQGFHLYSINDGDKGGEIGLEMFSGGLYWLYISDYRQHSLRAAYSLDRKQNRSSGSFLIGANTIYNSIYSGDGSISRYADRQHLLSLGPNGGYSYTWIFDNNMFINIHAIVGLNLSLNINARNWFFTPQILPKAALGYHGKTWSINVVGESEILIWRQDETIRDNTVWFSVSVTLMKRFFTT